eukprot:TRINITY_DN10343_c0_g3_i3.p1 TRINITY_DN10343_c0_g3~~TRINITY_DN10343_c0_g3_i3.p1  ORF type:complete len:249 (+),score=-11.66 TRINITY_DN10343_c0_g3_i3:708-1454(+)
MKPFSKHRKTKYRQYRWCLFYFIFSSSYVLRYNSHNKDIDISNTFSYFSRTQPFILISYKLSCQQLFCPTYSQGRIQKILKTQVPKFFVIKFLQHNFLKQSKLFRIYFLFPHHTQHTYVRLQAFFEQRKIIKAYVTVKVRCYICMHIYLRKKEQCPDTSFESAPGSALLNLCTKFNNIKRFSSIYQPHEIQHQHKLLITKIKQNLRIFAKMQPKMNENTKIKQTLRNFPTFQKFDLELIQSTRLVKIM